METIVQNIFRLTMPYISYRESKVFIIIKHENQPPKMMLMKYSIS